jgi:hypothetical protein
MKKLFLFLALSSSILFQSCTKEDDPTATTITLTAKELTINLGASVALTVINDLKQDVTATSTYTANGTAIDGAVFLAKTAGTYKIVAKNGSLLSNEVTVIVAPVATSIVLSTNETTIDLGKSATLKVLNDLAQNVTTTSTFTANGTAITNETFTPTVAGVYKLVAKNGTFVSNEITITVKEILVVNSIFYNGKNYPISNTAIEYMGKATTTGSTVATVALFRMVGYNSPLDYNNSTGTPKPTNVFSVIVRTQLTSAGEVVAPDPTNTTYVKLEGLKINDTNVTINSNQGGTFVLASDLPSAKNAPLSFKTSGQFNAGSTFEVDYNGNFNGKY